MYKRRFMEGSGQKTTAILSMSYCYLRTVFFITRRNLVQLRSQVVQVFDASVVYSPTYIRSLRPDRPCRVSPLRHMEGWVCTWTTQAVTTPSAPRPISSAKLFSM